MYVDVDRQHIGIGDHVVLLTRRNLDVLLAQAQHRRCQTWCLAREIQADGRLHAFDLARRSHMQLEHEVGSRVQTPGEIFRNRRQLTWSPAEEIAFRIVSRQRE
jgi:hypothetical protein